MAVPNSNRIDRLRTAIEAIAAGEGGGIIDRQREEAKAPIRARALRLLDQRARSHYELNERLHRAEPDTPTEIIDAVVADLDRSGLIDDAQFAKEWVRQRHQRRGKSRAALDQELQQKGVDADARETALAQITDTDEQERARQVVEKKVRTIRAIPADRHTYDKELRRLLGMLARRGFGTSMSVSVARAALDMRVAELNQQTDS